MCGVRAAGVVQHTARAVPHGDARGWMGCWLPRNHLTSPLISLHWPIAVQCAVTFQADVAEKAQVEAAAAKAVQEAKDAEFIAELPKVQV